MIAEEQIQAVGHRTVEGYAPDGIILFGAYAHGVPTENSDLGLLITKQNAEAKRVARAIGTRTLSWNADVPAMDILIRTLVEMERAAGIFQSVETIAEQQGRLFYAA